MPPARRHEAVPQKTRIHQFAEMPLNWLGYKITYRDVNEPLPTVGEMTRYRGLLTKVLIAIFVVSFVVLGWLGMQSGSTLQSWVARALTFYYFAFFITMPIWTRIDATKPVPQRVPEHD